MSLSDTQVFPPWSFDQWRAVDDRVRGGSSISHLDSVHIESSSEVQVDSPTEKVSKQKGARFWGNLDISTLGGAGFASQTHLFGPAPLHLSRVEYDGLRLSVLPDEHATESSPSNFTLILKNTIRTKPPKEPKLPPQPEPAVLSYEVSFPRPKASSDIKHSASTRVDFAWSDFKPHYRGREVPRDDEKWKPLDTEAIYEISFMCRSGFGKQEGDFGVVIVGLWGLKKGQLEMSQRVGGVESWSAWFGSWWEWMWSWFSSNGRVRLDEKV